MKSCWRPSMSASPRGRGLPLCCLTASALELEDRDLLPGVQPVALDGYRHVVGVEPHRHVELDVAGDLDPERRRCAEGDEPGRRVNGLARDLFYAVQEHLHGAGDRLGDGTDLDHAPGQIMLHQLELGLNVITCAEQLTGRLIISPVLEPEAVGAAPSRPKERDQLVDLRLLP